MSATRKITWLPAKCFTHGRHLHGKPCPVAGIVLHSSDNHQTADIAVLTGTDHKLSSHYYINREGAIWQFVQEGDTAWHAGVVFDAAKQSNAVTIGIEQEHIDGDPYWPDAQVRAAAWLVAGIRKRHNGHLPVLSHAQIAKPRGRKVDLLGYPWEKLSTYVAVELAS